MIIIVTGVSGSGKTTLGRLLARALGWQFVEGDDFHPPRNVDKMKAGFALTDEDRLPWLAALRKAIEQLIASQTRAVVTCSALKRSYRDALRMEQVRFVFLRVPYDVALQRIQGRRGHFFKPELLASQYSDLDEPEHAVVVDASLSAEAVMDEVIDKLDVHHPKPNDQAQ